MSIDVAKVKTHYRKDGTLHPRVLHKKVRSFDELLARMTKGTAITKGDMLSMWEHEVDAIRESLMDGFRVQTPLGDFSLGVRKSRNAGENQDQVDTSGIHMIFNINPDLLEEIRNNTAVNLVKAPAPRAPEIIKVANPRKGGAPDSAQVGKVFNVYGDLLSFDAGDPECGVFFWNGGGREAAVRAGAYSRIGSSRIDAEVPDSLEPGEYTMEIRTRPTKRDVRTGTYEKKVTIETP